MLKSLGSLTKFVSFYESFSINIVFVDVKFLYLFWYWQNWSFSVPFSEEMGLHYHLSTLQAYLAFLPLLLFGLPHFEYLDSPMLKKFKYVFQDWIRICPRDYTLFVRRKLNSNFKFLEKEKFSLIDNCNAKRLDERNLVYIFSIHALVLKCIF